MTKFRAIHIHATGKICTEHGDLFAEGSTARCELFFDSLKEAKEHTTEYTKLHPVIGCEIWKGEEKIEEVRNENAQAEFIQMFCIHRPIDKFKDVLIGFIFVASLIANVVMAFILLKN